MKMNILKLSMLLACATLAQTGYADGLSIKAGDTLQKQAAALKGKKVTVKLQGTEELSGIVKESTNELLQLSELSGKEFFDAIIDMSKVTAILVRTK
jgi:hypothetical protein